MLSQIRTREELEREEFDLLGPYAMKSSETGGREVTEPEHPYRSVYQRDKDRIIYSNAFRRLEYKTQVFVNHEGDYYRTRLTHTLEVAQIARTLARSLRLNSDLVEAIALAHDLGHTPFGHSGEGTLRELMKDNGGFDHNRHGLRVVDVLEERYPDFSGLNLTQETRRGIIRHSTPFDDAGINASEIPGPYLLEIQVVNMADQIAYDNHDLDDGLKSGLLSYSDMSGIPMWDRAERKIKGAGIDPSSDVFRFQMIRSMINMNVSDVLETTLRKLNEMNISSPEELPHDRNIVDFSDGLKKDKGPLRDVLMDRLYKHYRVVRMSNKASRFLRALFDAYVDNPLQLPPQAQEKIPERGKYQVVCDYMAGMTDRYALDQYKMFFEPYERV